MTRLDTELERLFSLSADGRLRTLVVAVPRNRDWPAVEVLLVGVQEMLGWSAPAVAADGEAGFQLWFPLAEPVSPADAAAFLDGLHRHFLGDFTGDDVAVLAAPDRDGQLRRVPALSAASGRWSAFIDPGMGALFGDEAGLGFEPNPDRQADLLARVVVIEAVDFARGLVALAHVEPAAIADPVPVINSCLGGGYEHPRDFLRAVMNDPGVPLVQRIEAAKALLPYAGER